MSLLRKKRPKVELLGRAEPRYTVVRDSRMDTHNQFRFYEYCFPQHPKLTLPFRRQKRKVNVTSRQNAGPPNASRRRREDRIPSRPSPPHHLFHTVTSNLQRFGTPPTPTRQNCFVGSGWRRWCEHNSRLLKTVRD